MELVRPNKDMKKDIEEFKKEFFDHGEKVINGSEMLDMINDIDVWLTKVTNNTAKETCDSNWVVTDTFLAIEDDRIIGIIDFRHELNDFLKDLGHCGYSVRPTERNKGYATLMLKLLLAYVKKLGYESIYLSVKQDNISSIKTISKNNGEYERSFKFNDELALVYKIIL